MLTAAAASVRSSFSEFIDAPDKLRRFVFVTGILIFVAGLCTAILCPCLMKISFSPTPYQDQWAILHDLSGGNKWYSLAWLWKQHNEHRVPLLRLAMVADFEWLGAHAYLLYALTFITLLSEWVIWAMVIQAIPGLPKAIWISIAGFLGFCLLCPNQYQNFYLAIQWTFVAAFFFASAAFIALVWFASRGRGWLSVSLSSVAAFLAECSLANGILTWPILVLASFALPVRRQHRMALCAIGASAISLYLYHYWQPQYHSDPLNAVRHPLRAAHYVTRYLDHCLSTYFVYPGILAITLSIAAFGALAFLLRRPETRVAALALTSSMSFVLATAAMTALGRLKFGIEQAQDSRYQSPVMLYWGCAFAALLLVAWELRSWRDIIALNTAAIAAIFLPLGNLKPLLESVKARADVVSLNGQSLDQGVIDPLPEQKQIFIPVTIATRYLHARGIKVAPNPPHVPISIVMSNWSKSACTGRFDAITALGRFDPGPPEIRADGWAINTRTLGPVALIAIVDDKDRVLSESSFHFGRADVLTARPGVHGRVGWHLYVPLSAQSRDLRAVAVVDGHGCPIDNVFAAPAKP